MSHAGSSTVTVSLQLLIDLLIDVYLSNSPVESSNYVMRLVTAVRSLVAEASHVASWRRPRVAPAGGNEATWCRGSAANQAAADGDV